MAIWVAVEIKKSIFPFDPEFFRLFRLLRLLRLIKLPKTMQGFDSLSLIATALKGSASVLIWACAFLFVIQMVLALLLTQLLTGGYFDDPSVPLDDRRKVYEYY